MLPRLIVIVMMAIFSFATAEAETTIAGQNNPAIDIQAVQNAVNRGGTINLKGTFDFGNEGRVNIAKDVKIIGEMERGVATTKIKGGFWTLHSTLPAKLPPEAPGPKITIQGILFDGASWAPIHLAYSSGATISKNKITNVRPRAVSFPLFGKTGLNMQQGVLCSAAFIKKATPKDIFNAFTGPLIVEDNDIDLTNDVPTKTMAQGVFVLWTTGINAQIQRNTVINSARTSIETIDNFRGKDGTGLVIIKENRLVTDIEGVPVPSPNTPNGILVGWFLDNMPGGVDPERNIKYMVVNNGIRTRGKTSQGITAFTDGVVVANNAIVAEGTDASGINVFSSDGYIANNRTEGASSRTALKVGVWKPFKGSKNVFINNDLSQFRTPTHVLLEKDTCNNLVMGFPCQVNDLGSNNSIRFAK